MTSRHSKKERLANRTVRNGSRAEAFNRPGTKDQQNAAGQNKTSRISDWFGRFATSTSRIAGKPVAFVIAVAIIGIWALVGPAFGFSDTWQLIINTSTTIVTFLMVFLIQNTQNRDGEAIQIKLDELIRSIKGAHNSLLDIEKMTVEDLDKLRGEYEELAKKARHELKNRQADADGPQY